MDFQIKLERVFLYALLAAAMNGSIGTITRFLLERGMPPHQIAFTKCFCAFLLLFAFVSARKGGRQSLAALGVKWKSFALLSFLGIFCLYCFETWAFSSASIPLVSFLTYAAGGFTLLLAAVFLGERLNLAKLATFLLIAAGVYLIFSFERGLHASALGIALALAGGLGYSLFLVASKLLKIGSGLDNLVWLFGIGSLYLLIPALHSGFATPDLTSWLAILSLVMIPTIGGFYFTTRALQVGEASKVQIVETSDPVFSTVFGFVAFGDRLTVAGFFGAALIFTGLLLASLSPAPRNPEPS